MQFAFAGLCAHFALFAVQVFVYRKEREATQRTAKECEFSSSKCTSTEECGTGSQSLMSTWEVMSYY
jgi:hypothetical protein